MVQTNQISVFDKEFFLLKNYIFKGRGLVSGKQDGTNKPDFSVRQRILFAEKLHIEGEGSSIWETGWYEQT
jgi:hypothetical protein